MLANRELSIRLVLEDEGYPKKATAPTREELLYAWERIQADSLDRGLDYFALDTAIASGVWHTSRWFNLIAGCESVEIEDGTIYYVNRIEPQTIIDGLEFYRRRRLRLQPQWAVLGPAWTNRVNRAKRRALKMIHGEL